ncbi:MAG: hypothetical protein QXD78_06365 [Candidatus Bathyarchaeia archaeon]
MLQDEMNARFDFLKKVKKASSNSLFVIPIFKIFAKRFSNTFKNFDLFEYP